MIKTSLKKCKIEPQAGLGHAPRSTGPRTAEDFPAKLSQLLWGLSWREHLPFAFSGTHIVARELSFEGLAAFLATHAHLLMNGLGESSSLPREELAGKETYYRSCADLFAFQEGERVIGVFVANPLDWSTYYFRFKFILPEFRGNHYLIRFMDHICSVLREYNVKRIETEVSPSNLGQIKRLAEMQFNLTGTRLTDRWGGLNIMTKYLCQNNQLAFINQFCQGAEPQVKRGQQRRIK